MARRTGTFALFGLLAMMATAQAEEVRIAAPIALTGKYAFVGVPISKGMQVAVEEINASGRLGPDRTLSLLMEDYGSEKSEAITLLNRFVTGDGVLVVVGPSSTEDSLAVAPVADSLQVPLLTNAVLSKVRETSPWAFNIPAPTDVSVRALCAYVVDRFKPKTFAGVATRNSPGAVNELKAARECLSEKGVELLLDDSVLGTDTDFSVLATKLAALNPDILVVTGTDNLAANLKQQIIQAGGSPDIRIMGSNALAGQNYLDLGGSAVEGSILVADYFVDNDNPINQSFVKAYQAMYGTNPDNWSAIGYTMVQVAAFAIEKAGPGASRQQILDVLTSLSGMPTVLGSGVYSFGEGRAPTYGQIFLLVEDGKFVLAPRD